MTLKRLPRARMAARAAVLAIASFALVASAASAFTIVDPGFSSGTYVAAIGVQGIAFDGAGALHTNTDGGLAYVGSQLYGVSRTAGEIRALDASGASQGVVPGTAAIPCPDGLAASDTDLYVTTCQGIYRVRSVNTAPVVEYFANPGSTQIAAHAIAIGADGVIFATAGSNVWIVGRTTDVAPAFGQILISVPNAHGLAVLAPLNGSGIPAWRFIFTTLSNGEVGVFDRLSVVPTHVIVNGGSGGDHSTIGPDGCLYVPQSGEIARIANANGTCDLVGALGATPAVELSGGASRPHVNANPVTFTAHVANAPAGTLVTFTVTGANPQPSAVVPLDPATQRATFSYTGTTVGDDHVTASVTVAGVTYTSNEIVQHWYPPIDTTPPVITFTVTSAGPDPNVVCPGAPAAGYTNGVYCGWYATAPTVHWTAVDPDSGVVATNGCVDFTLAGDSPAVGTPVTCTATNADGLQATRTVVLQALTTPPMIAASAVAGVLPYTGGPTRGPVIVSFACTQAAGAFAIASCGPGETISSGDGTPRTVTGTALTLSGQSATASSGPILVDTTPPVVTVTATLAGGGTYVFGTWTAQPVTVSFRCTDPSGVPSCPSPQTYVTSTAASSVSVADALGNVRAVPVGVIAIDTVPPTTVAAVTGMDAGGGMFATGAIVTLSASDAGAGVAAVTYAVDGVPASVSASTVSITLDTAGTHVVTYGATDHAGNTEVARSLTVTIVDRLATTLTIISADLLAQGTRVGARLVTTAGTPIAGETITFGAGSATATATTGADGIASADLGLATGRYTLTATYAGSARFFSSNATKDVLVYALTRFVVWAPNAIVGARVQFWGDDWAKQIADKRARSALDDFKGYAGAVFDRYWTGRTGDRVKPPAIVPEYIGVILTSSASQTRDTIRGDVAGIAVLRVERYDRRLGERAYGTVAGMQGP